MMENEESEYQEQQEVFNNININISRLKKFETAMANIYKTGEFTDFTLLSHGHSAESPRVE